MAQVNLTLEERRDWLVTARAMVSKQLEMNNSQASPSHRQHCAEIMAQWTAEIRAIDIEKYQDIVDGCAADVQEGGCWGEYANRMNTTLGYLLTA